MQTKNVEHAINVHYCPTIKYTKESFSIILVKNTKRFYILLYFTDIYVLP